MSKTFEALRKAEAERNGTASGNGNGNGASADVKPPKPRPPVSPAHLEYEKIRVWLKTPNRERPRIQSVMVLACHSGSGATTTAALLATTLAEGRNSRVLLIDTNFRTPSQNLFFRVENEPGMEPFDVSDLPFDPRIQRTNHANLFVLTCSQLPGCPLEVFEGDEILDLITAMKRRFDFIVFDAPPALDYPDAYALAPKVDGIILVTEAERTLIEDAQRARRDLERAGGNCLGVVLNRQTNPLPRFLHRFFASP